MTTEQKMIQIFRAILVEMNGYPEKKCTDEFVLLNKGSDLWDKIEKVVKSKTTTE